MIRIARTSLTAYNDTAASSDLSFYRLSALDSAGSEAAVSSCVWGRLRKLSAPTGAKVSNDLSPHILLLQWDSVSGSRDYVVYRSAGYCPDADQEYARTASPLFRDTVRSAGYFYYSIAAVNTAGRVSEMSACVRGAAVPLCAPESLKASYDEHPEVIDLSWKAIPQAHHYFVHRALGGCASKMYIVDSMVTSARFTDSVPTSDSFSYIVTAVDSEGIKGQPSACVSGRVKLLPAPANVKASNGLYTNKIRISWDPVAGADGYICYRGQSNLASSAVPVDTVTSLFEFDTVPTTSLHYFWVEARDRLGPGRRSGYVWGRTFMPPVLSGEMLNDSAFVLSWVADTSATKWKYIYQYTYIDDRRTLFDSSTGSSYSSVISDYGEHIFYITAKTAVGDSEFSGPVTFARCPPTPTGLSATGAEDCVYLHWNGIRGVSSYTIFRSDSISDSTEYFEWTSDTFFVDYSATRANHCYQVMASSSGGDSKPSEKVVAGILNPPGRKSKF
jgi:fibronectin type 3 domain-containing protein